MCENSCLYLLTYAINDAYTRGKVDLPTTYSNLIKIGEGVCPALGNSKPPTFTWTGAANQNDSSSSAAQQLSWNPYTTANTDPVITSWGYIRLLALQAWNEFNYNNALGQYKDFLTSWMTSYSFVEYSNQAILASDNSKTFLDGTYSNMDDLISADVVGVNMALPSFGQDFIATGKAIDLATISTFGLPSNLLRTLQRYNAVTKSVTLALLASGIDGTSELNDILGKVNPVTATQEQYIYRAFSIIVGQDLVDVCVPLNCKTPGLNSLVDLLNPQKLFPNSYTSLTVPVYNATPMPTNSKTYYPIYEGSGVSSRLITPAIATQIGTQVASGTPAVNSADSNSIQIAGTSYNTLSALTGTPNQPNKFNFPSASYISADDMADNMATAAQNIINKTPVPVEDIGSAYPNRGSVDEARILNNANK